MLVSVFLIHVLISLSVTATTLVIDVMKYEICGAVSGSLAEFKRLIRTFRLILARVLGYVIPGA
jgi:hypothetical protein